MYITRYWRPQNKYLLIILLRRQVQFIADLRQQLLSLNFKYESKVEHTIIS